MHMYDYVCTYHNVILFYSALIDNCRLAKTCEINWKFFFSDLELFFKRNPLLIIFSSQPFSSYVDIDV